MADARSLIGWGEVVRGREERALEVFNETIQFYRAVAGGRPDRELRALPAPSRTAAISPASSCSTAARSRWTPSITTSEFQRLVMRANFIVDNLE